MEINENEINPLTYTNYSKRYYEIKRELAKTDLPMYRPDSIAEMNKLLDENDIVILKSGTGSGKTIAVPINVLKKYKFKGKFVLTQPRSVITKKNADFIADQLDIPIGSFVAYKFKDSDEVSSSTILTVMTDGTLLQQFINNQETYDVIMIDEFHERNTNIDLLIFLIRMYLQRRNTSKNFTGKKIKFMFLSATINEQKYVNYFKLVPSIKIGVMVSARGKSFNVTSYYIGDSLPDGSIHTYLTPSLMVDYLLEKTVGDILVFLPSVSLVLKMAQEYAAKAKKVAGGESKVIDKDVIGTNKLQNNIIKDTTLDNKNGTNLPINNDKDVILDNKNINKDITLDNKLSSIDPNIVKKNNGLLVGTLYAKQTKELNEIYIAPNTRRRLIFSTNVAQVGLTVNGLRHVVDTGTKIAQYYDTIHSIFELRLQFIGKNDAIQRHGRAGRTNDGFAYCIYTKEDFDKFGNSEEPEILRTNAMGVLMNYIRMTDSMKVSAEFMAQMIDPIDHDTINFAKRALMEYGYVLEDKLTYLGKMANEFEMDYDLSSLIANSFRFKVHRVGIIIGAMLFAGRSLGEHINLREMSKAIALKLSNVYGEHHAVYSIFMDFYNNFYKNFQYYPKEKYVALLASWKAKNGYLTDFDNVLKKVNEVTTIINKYINDRQITIITNFYKSSKEIDKLPAEKKIWEIMTQCMIETWPDHIARKHNDSANYYVSEKFMDVAVEKFPFIDIAPNIGYSRIIVMPSKKGQRTEIVTKFRYGIPEKL